ncbi:hypothetical protein Vadar_005237 [Vaccinium darrowii]|uniref:Uncharacterized protein n=1 Tax=Vaccinium darrowii TaxID=229202 RepID=A0ACB7XND5_9ERIC|nr:hypothetical protein Vadar_005237 [Vaccinium darrowii]
MCMNGMHWGLIYIFQRRKLRTFKELATSAYDVEISIANHGGKNPPILEKPSDKKDVKKGDKFSKGTTKDSIMVTTALVKITAKDKKWEVKKEFHPMEKDKCLTLKELQGKKYPFPDYDVLGMPEGLLEKRELLVNLASKNRILLDLDEATKSNHTTIVVGSQGSSNSGRKTKQERVTTLAAGTVAKTIQFGSPEPMIIQVPSQDVSTFSCIDKNPSTKTDDGWILVTRKKSLRNRPEAKPVHPRRGHRKNNHHQYAKRKGGRKMKAKKKVLQIHEPVKQNPLALVTL